MDKFLLAENPFRPEQSGLYIVHLLNPKAIIQCIEGHVTTSSPFRHYQYQNKDGVIEEWTLSAFHFFTTDFISEPEKQVTPLLDRAWRWYRSYLEWEDKNIDLDELGEKN